MEKKTTISDLVESLEANLRFEIAHSLEALNAKVVSENIKEGDTVAVLGVVRRFGNDWATLELHGQARHPLHPNTVIHVPMCAIRLDAKDVTRGDS